MRYNRVVAYDAEELAQHVRALERENAELRERLEAIELREQRGKDARAKLMRGGFRVLVPLFDRQKVVRSFGKLAETVGDYSGPPGQWPAREEVLLRAREFMESVVRFMVRRRFFLMFVGLVAGAIPALQIWLVIQQNEIIQNQNDLFQIQVYDVVARSMTEGDRNARLMTGALLADADLAFLQDVVQEAFDPTLSGIYRAEGVHAATRRLEDTAFRGHLVRSATRATEKRAAGQDAQDPEELLRRMRPTFQTILRDAESRVAEVHRLGRNAEAVDGALGEQVDNYLAQLWTMSRVYGRLARSAEQEGMFHQDMEPFLSRVARLSVADSRFALAHQTGLQDFLFEMAIEPRLGERVDLAEAGLTPEQAISRGVSSLQEKMGQDAADWQRLRQQAEGP